MDWSVSPKDEILFLRVCHHISTGLYFLKVKISRISNKHKMAALSMACLHAAAGRVNRNLNIRGNLINKSTLLKIGQPEVPVQLSIAVYKLRMNSQRRYCA